MPFSFCLGLTLLAWAAENPMPRCQLYSEAPAHSLAPRRVGEGPPGLGSAPFARVLPKVLHTLAAVLTTALQGSPAVFARIFSEQKVSTSSPLPFMAHHGGGATLPVKRRSHLFCPKLQWPKRARGLFLSFNPAAGKTPTAGPEDSWQACLPPAHPPTKAPMLLGSPPPTLSAVCRALIQARLVVGWNPTHSTNTWKGNEQGGTERGSQRTALPPPPCSLCWNRAWLSDLPPPPTHWAALQPPLPGAFIPLPFSSPGPGSWIQHHLCPSFHPPPSPAPPMALRAQTLGQ